MIMKDEKGFESRQFKLRVEKKRLDAGLEEGISRKREDQNVTMAGEGGK